MEGFVALVTAALLFGFIPWTIMKTIQGRKGSGKELSTSELRSLINEAVDEATRPLRRRIETLEAINTDPDDPLGRGFEDDEVEGDASRIDPALLADDPLAGEEQSEAVGARRRTRS